jgi:hypothetical protein
MTTEPNEPSLAQLIKSSKLRTAAIARALGRSDLTVRRWIENNKVPPKMAIKLANVLDVEIPEILPFADRAKSQTKPTMAKSMSDFEVIDHYRQTGVLPSDTALTEHSVKSVLVYWGDRWPLMYKTIMGLHRGEITASDAAKTLGITPGAIHNIRRRYGLNPGRRKKAAPITPPTKKVRLLALDVIAGRVSAVAASKSNPDVSLRTLHRHIELMIRPEMLNELAHWSLNFRSAYALDVDKKRGRVVLLWRKQAEKRGFLLKKRPTLPKPVTNWRSAPLWRLAVAVLLGEQDLEEIALLRGGEAHILGDLVEGYLRQMNLDGWDRSLFHKAAAAEVILAEQSHFRRPIFEAESENVEST